MRESLRSWATVALLGLWLVAPAVGQQLDTSAQQDASANPLDQLLLDGLDNPLLEGLAPLPPAGRSDSPAAGASELDRMLLQQLGQGEDLGRESADPFLAIGQRMRAAEELISRRHTVESERVQREILDDLDRLIEQLKKQCAAGQCNSSSSQSASASAAKPGSKPGKAGSGENRGSSQPANDSEERVGRSDGEEAQLARMRELHKQVWGHLPARIRDQMQSGLAEEFLPQYERLIEQYYQRLAEQRGVD